MTSRVSREDLMQEIVSVAHSLNLDLYDLDYPSLESKTLRVFISKLKSAVTASANQEIASKDGVTLEECAKVSRHIMNWLEEQQVPGHEDWDIEVSSPGINRKLKTLDHFRNAAGERIKLTFRDKETKAKKTLLLKLEKVENDQLMLFQAASSGKKQKRSPSAGKVVPEQQSLTVDFSDVESAQVDFDFV